METFIDSEGHEIRLTDERIVHIQQRHPEISRFDHSISETLETPDTVLQDKDDPEVWTYNRWYTGTIYGEKWMVVVVIRRDDDSFVATAYITNEI